jgi:hypothetical protein
VQFSNVVEEMMRVPAQLKIAPPYCPPEQLENLEVVTLTVLE